MIKSRPYRSEDLLPDYEVGYAKPPTHAQFKKGQSGNPRGRPKGSINLITLLRRTLNEKVTIHENGRQRAVSKGEAAIKQLVNRSAQGEIAYMRLLLPAMTAADVAFAAEASKTSIDLTDPALLAPLLAQLDQGSHVVLKPATPPRPSPTEQGSGSDVGTTGAIDKLRKE